MNKLLSIAVATLLVAASSFHSQASAGVLSPNLLGSFENLPAGQDGPIAAVIAAIQASTNVIYSDLERLYKNDYTSGGGTGSNSLFSTNYTISPNGDVIGGAITQLTNPISINGKTFTPLFYTAKINGRNAGFNLYAWDDSASNFNWGFFKDDSPNALTYSYVDKGETKTNIWAEPNTGQMVNYSVSHVSVFGAVVDENGGGGGDPVRNGPGGNVVPEPSSLVIFGVMLGAAGFRRRRNGVAKKQM